jgi:hypothetical protein
VEGLLFAWLGVEVGGDGGVELGSDGGVELGWDGGVELGWDGGVELGWDGGVGGGGLVGGVCCDSQPYSESRELRPRVIIVCLGSNFITVYLPVVASINRF